MTTGTVTSVTDVTITATLPTGSVSSQLQIGPPEAVSDKEQNRTRQEA
jgi:hypothetical protein